MLYALQATLQLAEAGPGSPVPCSRLAEKGRMPERFLLQILRNLVTHGLLRSTRGVDGGYTLLREPDEISLLDLIEAIDGPLGGSDTVPRDDGMSGEALAKLQLAIDGINDRLRDDLSSIKLSDLMPEYNARLAGRKATSHD
jgi:Rrf2 family protein